MCEICEYIWPIRLDLEVFSNLLAPSTHDDPALHGLFSHVICFKISHCGPSYSSVHEQTYDASISVQIPPFLQGLLAHSSISIEKNQVEKRNLIMKHAKLKKTTFQKGDLHSH